LTSHSPLFLLGMEKVYGNEGFQIIDVPGGQTITTERFSEFQRSWEYYRRTAAYEEEIRNRLATGAKPLVLTEGETDVQYIRTALELFTRQDILDAVDIEWVGVQGERGPLNTGQKGLDNTRNVFRRRHSRREEYMGIRAITGSWWASIHGLDVPPYRFQVSRWRTSER
jgi:hypothetical protein